MEAIILREKEERKRKQTELNRLIEFLPFSLLKNPISQVHTHLLKQHKKDSPQYQKMIKDKFDLFIEKLFNAPPEPTDGQMPFKIKTFYYEKAKNLTMELFDSPTHHDEFSVDLTSRDQDMIRDFIHQSRQFSLKEMAGLASELFSLEKRISEEESKLRRIESELEDKTIQQTRDEKDSLERTLSDAQKSLGGLEEKIKNLAEEREENSDRYERLLEAGDLSKSIQNKLDQANDYISVLGEFIIEQKEGRKKEIESNLYKELEKVMHKMQIDDSNFISKVSVDIIPGNKGLKVSLKDIKGREIPKGILSTGEKQIYISCLIKTILSQSTRKFPIFIDTPLARLDKTHTQSILKNCYPHLAEQVILLSTDSEIPPDLRKLIHSKISKEYHLRNKEGKSYFESGTGDL